MSKEKLRTKKIQKTNLKKIFELLFGMAKFFDVFSSSSMTNFCTEIKSLIPQVMSVVIRTKKRGTQKK